MKARIVLISCLLCGLSGLVSAQTTYYSGDTNKKLRASVWINPDGGIIFKTKDDFFVSSLRGYFQLAPVFFTGDTKDTVNNIQNFYSGFTIPEARLEWSGSVDHDWHYRFSYDFSEKKIKDANMSYTGVKNLLLMGGQYKPAYSAIGNIAMRAYRVFLDDSLPVIAFVPSFLLGAQAEYFWSQWSLAGGIVTPPSVDQYNGVPLAGASDPVGATTRIGFGYSHDPRRSVYFDVGNYFTQTIDRNSTEFRAIPELTGRTNAYLVDTDQINGVDFYTVPDAEFAAVYGSFFTSGGYYLDAVHQETGGNYVFDGYTVEVGYFLTGEYRELNIKLGEFGTISPVQHAYGALQIGARYSYVNLSSGDVAGGREGDESLVFNWYPKNRFRLGLEYVHAAATPSDNGLDRQMNIFAMIGQVLL